MIEKAIKVYLGAPQGITPPIKLSQYDTNWRLRFTVYDGDSIWSIPDSATVVLEGRKKDGTVFAANGTVDNVNVVVDCTPQMTSVGGDVECELRFATDTRILGTANFLLKVEPAPVSGYVASADDFSGIDQLVTQALHAAERINDVSVEIAKLTSLVGSPLVANEAAEMTNQNKIYVYTGEEPGMDYGYWYYYDGSAWVRGDVYNSVAVSTDKTLSIEDKAADAKAVGDQIEVVLGTVRRDDPGWNIGLINASTGAIDASYTNRAYTEFIKINDATAVEILSGAKVGVRLYDKDLTFLPSTSTLFTESFNVREKIRNYTVAPQSVYIRFVGAYTSDADVTVDGLSALVTVSGNLVTAADEADVKDAIYKSKNPTSNEPAALTYWRPAADGYSDSNPFSPVQMPNNSFTYALGSYMTSEFAPAGVSLVNGRGYWVFKFVAATVTNRIFIVYDHAGKKIFIGRTVASSQGVPVMIDYSPMKSTADIMWFGDSITRGVNSDGVDPISGEGSTAYSSTNLPNLVAAELGCTIDNYGIGTIGYLDPADPEDEKGTAYDYLTRVGEWEWYWQGVNAGSSNKFFVGDSDPASMRPWSDYNTIILSYGANDRAVDHVSTELGSVQDLIDGEYDDMTDTQIEAVTPPSIIVAMYKCYRYIRKVAPEINIIITDPIMQIGGSAPEWSYPTRRESGTWSWYELCEMYADFAKRYGCGHISNFDAPINRVTPKVSLHDGVHPTKNCYRQLARHFAGKISALVM